MKAKLLNWIIPALVLTGCTNHDLGEMTPNPNQNGKDDVKNNVENVFGVTFDANHDWCTTASGKVTISGIPSGTTKVQLYALIAKDVKDEDNQNAVETSLLKLNEDDAVSGSQVTLVYDAPSLNKGIYAAIEYDGKRYMKLVNNGTATFANSNRAATVRRAPSDNDFAGMTLAEEVESFASQRGWLPGQKLYGMSDEAYQTWKTNAEGYSDEFTQLFRNIVFSYFKNGRQYNNFPLIKESQLINDKGYPITTGTSNIVVSPIYKSDKAGQYGNEVWNSDIWHY